MNKKRIYISLVITVLIILIIILICILVKYVDTEQLYAYLQKYKKEITNISIGAVLGFFASLGATYLFQTLKIFNTERYLKKFKGIYTPTRKDGEDSGIIKVEIKTIKNNVLFLIFETKLNGEAKGELIIDDCSESYGRGMYYHVDVKKENLSGFYDVILIRPGLIHAKATYVSRGETNQDVIDQYIWKR